MKMSRRRFFWSAAGGLLFADLPQPEGANCSNFGAVSVLSLTDAMCKYPIGDPVSPTFAFCGREAHCGPYCGAHARLAYQPSEMRSRRRSPLAGSI